MAEKRCRFCGLIFLQIRKLQVVCSPVCAIAYSCKWKNEKLRRQYNETTKSHWEKKARTSCHAYIRLRDNKLPCVSCGRFHAGQYHAGHYRPSGVNSALRYDERNIHKQCSPCNNHKSGNLSEYRKTLVQKLGIETVEWLDNNHEVKKWTLQELKEIHWHFAQKSKELKLLSKGCNPSDAEKTQD